jgi:hypothetical protein
MELNTEVIAECRQKKFTVLITDSKYLGIPENE